MRKYKTWEAIKMLEEGKAKEFKFENYGIENVNGNILFIVENGKYAPMSGLTIGIEWELVQQPVSFMEAITANKKIKVEHSLIKEGKVCINKVFDMSWKKLINGEHITQSELFSVLGWMFNDKQVRKIIKEGKWYTEGE